MRSAADPTASVGETQEVMHNARRHCGHSTVTKNEQNKEFIVLRGRNREELISFGTSKQQPVSVRGRAAAVPELQKEGRARPQPVAQDDKELLWCLKHPIITLKSANSSSCADTFTPLVISVWVTGVNPVLNLEKSNNIFYQLLI